MSADQTPVEPKPFCCELTCGSDAEVRIVTMNGGPDPYSDVTDSCLDHVGALLGHQPDAVRPEAVYWEVRLIERALALSDTLSDEQRPTAEQASR